MATEPTPNPPPKIRTPRQQRIHRRLGLIGEGPQAFYEDILRTIAGEVKLDAASHVAGHLLRELESAIRDALEPITKHEGAAASDKKEKDGHARQIKAILVALGISETEGIGASWLDLATGEVRPHNVAHRSQFNRPLPVDESFLGIWEPFESVLDVVLDRFESQYADLHKSVDALLTKPVPTAADLDFLGGHLPNNPVIRFYFFENLNHPGWLVPLADRDYFRRPPAATRNDEKGSISFTAWAAPIYLQKMAAIPDCQKQVLDIVAAMPDNDNIYVLDDLVKILSALPVGLAATGVPRLIALHQLSPAIGLGPERIAELAVRLAGGGHIAESIQLLKAILAVKPEETRRVSGRAGPRAVSQIEDYEYSQVIDRQIPKLLAIAPDAVLGLLRELLQQVLGFIAEAESGHDMSWIWRRSIEQANRGGRYEVRDLLIDAVRDAALVVCHADPSRLRGIVADFESKEHAVWHRLALFLLARMPDVAPDLVEERVRRKDLFDEWGEHPEYSQLLASAFSNLQADVQAEILAWIEAGPPADHVEDLEPKERAERTNAWQLRRLTPLKGNLPEEWEKRVAAQGPAEDDASEDGAIWVGPTSPITPAELAALPPEQVADYLRGWQPGAGRRSPSAEGLGRVLSKVVAERPAGFAAAAPAFVGLDPTFVRSFLHGFVEAVKETRGFDWNLVIELCEWAVSQPREPLGDSSYHDRDPGWSWSRATVARLITAGMDSDALRIPINLRDRLWRIIEIPTWDPDPGPDREIDRDPESGYDIAVNSVRGDGVAAAIRYGVWVKRLLQPERSDSLTAMPELQNCLEQHLDPEREASIAIWSVFGQSLPVLHWLDPEWVVKNLAKLLPANERLRDAMWLNYLKWNPPYDDVFLALRTEYVAAVNRLSGDDKAAQFGSAAGGLVSHLMSYYWRGAEGATELVDVFSKKASTGFKKDAVEFIGRSLFDTEEDLPGDVAGRLRQLWERILTDANLAESGNRSVLEPFAWWLASGRLDLDWSIKQGLAVLGTGAVLEPDHLVVEYLEELAKQRPLESAQLLSGICDNISPGSWSIHGWRDHAMTALRVVLDSGNAEAVKQGRAVVNKLVARGFPKFKDLL